LLIEVDFAVPGKKAAIFGRREEAGTALAARKEVAGAEPGKDVLE
jgi:hypothetical protein